MGTMTVEDYVSDIMEDLEDADFDSILSVCDTLDRMKYSSKEKYRHNYWKVLQCLGEMACDKCVTILIKSREVSCKCHFATNLEGLLQLFVDMMCNVKVIKRINMNLSQIAPVLFKAVRQHECSHLQSLALKAIHRLIIVGKTKCVEFFIKKGLLKDLCKKVKSIERAEMAYPASISTMKHSTKMLLTLSICGEENVWKEVIKSGIFVLIGDYLGQMEPKKVNSLSAAELCEAARQLADILEDYTKAESKHKNWKPKVKLQEELKQDQLYLFCSSPACRKIYGETKGFRYCGACRLARYCCETCQREHWKNGHREACQRNGLST